MSNVRYLRLKHHYSEQHITAKVRPLGNQASVGMVYGVATVSWIVVPYYLWQLRPLPTGAVLAYAAFILLITLVAIVFVFLRRLFVVSRRALEQLTIDITHGGVWRDLPGDRTLVLGAAEISRIDVFRRIRQIERVVLGGQGRQATLAELRDMELLVADLQNSFPRARVLEHRLDFEPTPIEGSESRT